MYSLHQFGYMINDRVRLDAYAEALRQVIRPNDVVLDIGAGTGFFSLLACQLGASHVYAVETNVLIELGEQMAIANGYADRIEFIRDMSTNITLPMQADVVIADLRGQLPLYGGNISSFADARKRLLKPGGRLIPQRDTLYATLISAPEAYRRNILEPWVENKFQLDMSAALSLLVNMNVQDNETPTVVLLPPQIWTTIDYNTREEPNVTGTMDWVVEQAGTADFICVWFDAELIEGVGFSTAPNSDNSATIYGRGMLPLEKPIQLEPGDQVTLTLSANLISDSYQYTWKTHVVSGGTVKADFQQSTFFGMVLSDIRKRAVDYTPQISTRGQIMQFILSSMDEALPIKDIAQRLRDTFPGEFLTEADALEKVCNITSAYGK